MKFERFIVREKGKLSFHHNKWDPSLTDIALIRCWSTINHSLFRVLFFLSFYEFVNSLNWQNKYRKNKKLSCEFSVLLGCLNFWVEEVIRLHDRRDMQFGVRNGRESIRQLRYLSGGSEQAWKQIRMSNCWKNRVVFLVFLYYQRFFRHYPRFFRTRLRRKHEEQEHKRKSDSRCRIVKTIFDKRKTWCDMREIAVITSTLNSSYTVKLGKLGQIVQLITRATKN